MMPEGNASKIVLNLHKILKMYTYALILSVIILPLEF